MPIRTIPAVYVRSAQNFGLEGFELFRRVVFPAATPAIITSLRLALGIAWMVIVAAEMIAVDSGLGYLIMDARNANNYERVVGSMLTIGPSIETSASWARAGDEAAATAAARTNALRQWRCMNILPSMNAGGKIAASVRRRQATMFQVAIIA